jgi:hypothetical protein
MEFIVRSPANQPDVVEVRYDCACGCKPRARYRRGADEANHEHCCCIVHFVGAKASDRLDAYLADRATRHEDDDVGGYTRHQASVTAPWGDAVPVAYALPHRLRKH